MASTHEHGVGGRDSDHGIGRRRDDDREEIAGKEGTPIERTTISTGRKPLSAGGPRGRIAFV